MPSGRCHAPSAAAAACRWRHLRKWRGAELQLEARLGHPLDARVALICAQAQAPVADVAAAEALGLAVVAQLRAAGGEALLAALPSATADA